MGYSEEEAGRYVRYQAFEEVLKEVKGNKIAVAHNKNDVVETVFKFNKRFWNGWPHWNKTGKWKYNKASH